MVMVTVIIIIPLRAGKAPFNFAFLYINAQNHGVGANVDCALVYAAPPLSLRCAPVRADGDGRGVPVFDNLLHLRAGASILPAR